MEMHQVRYFLAVAEALNFTQAAEQCHVAQPSLSRAIIKLEEELGGELFRRERGLTHLTELGKLMQPLMSQCYESAVAAKTLAASYKKGVCAPLRVALSHTVNIQLLIKALTELVKAFPGLELKFFRGTATEVAEQLKSGEAELGIACPLGIQWERLEAWTLFHEGFELVVHKAHPLALKNRVGLADLSSVRILPRNYCEQFESYAEALAEKGIAIESGSRSASDHDLVALLLASAGASILPASAWPADGLKSLPVDGLDIIRPVVLYAVSGRQRSPAATALLKLLRAANWKQAVTVAEVRSVA
jgi:DNA-binding transcriptional LysR family regulator